MKKFNFWMWVAAVASAFFSAQLFTLFMPGDFPDIVKYIITAAVGMSFSVAVIRNEQREKPYVIGKNMIALTTVLGAAMFVYASLDASSLRSDFNQVALNNFKEVSKHTKENMERDIITATAKALTASSFRINLSPDASAMLRDLSKKTKTHVEYWYLGFALIAGCALESSLRYLSRRDGTQNAKLPAEKRKIARGKTQNETHAKSPVKRGPTAKRRIPPATISAIKNAFDNAFELGLTHGGKPSKRKIAKRCGVSESTVRKVLGGSHEIG